ncbi:protein-tyrosine phosphatase family protein [Gemmata sp.]|uniref:protein-tyrosine phosphatase family protein n=1 Tax=Gemmata sp. TaxID=1914242 RepID=UPI003F6ECDF7
MPDQTEAPTFDCNWVPVGNGRLTLWHRPGARAVPALRAFGCDCVVTLLSAREGAAVVGELVEQVGIEWVWLPLENGQPPRGTASEAVLAALPVLAERLDGGRSILIHCSAGIHRTGMVAFALMRWHSYTEEQGLAAIGRMRAHTGAGVQRKQVDWGNLRVVPGLSSPSARAGQDAEPDAAADGRLGGGS